MEEQRTEAYLAGKLNRAKEHSLGMKGFNRSAGADGKQVHDENWNLGSAKAVLSRESNVG